MCASSSTAALNTLDTWTTLQPYVAHARCLCTGRHTPILTEEQLRHHQVIYTDGACAGKKGNRSAAYAVVWDACPISQTFLQHFANTNTYPFWALCMPDDAQHATNQRAEMQAIVVALRTITDFPPESSPNIRLPALLLTDSQFCVNLFSRWRFDWAKKFTAASAPVGPLSPTDTIGSNSISSLSPSSFPWWERTPRKNMDILGEFMRTMERLHPEQIVSICHVKAHAEVRGNNYVDKLAQQTNRKRA